MSGDAGRIGRSAAWAALLQATTRPLSGEQLSTALRTALSLRTDVAPATVGCSITEVVGDQLRTPVWSDQLALELDHTQYDAGKGPCIDAARHRRVRSWGPADAGDAGDAENSASASDVRYALFAEAALQRGVFSSLSIPLRTRSRPAALNFYGTAADTFHGARPRAVADLLARCIGRLLLDSTAAESSRTSDDDAGVHTDAAVSMSAWADVDEDALAVARWQHEQVVRAQHAVMSERGLSAQDAFTVLSELSRTQRQSIADVARSVLTPTGNERESSDA